MSPGHLAHLSMPWHLESNKAPHAQVTVVAVSYNSVPLNTAWDTHDDVYWSIIFPENDLLFTSCNIFCCGLGPSPLITLLQIFPVLLSWYINTVLPLLPAQQLPGSSKSCTISWDESQGLSSWAICETWIWNLTKCFRLHWSLPYDMQSGLAEPEQLGGCDGAAQSSEQRMLPSTSRSRGRREKSSKIMSNNAPKELV